MVEGSRMFPQISPHPQVARDQLSGRILPRSTPDGFDSCQRQKNLAKTRFSGTVVPVPKGALARCGFANGTDIEGGYQRQQA